MEHTSLYRKYRPETFADVLGQDHVVSVIEKAIKDGKPAHAYIFSGGRGIGKTTIARIFASTLGTAKEDIIEIDAASNRKIEDIRSLRDGIRVLPFSSKYKVYILDEAHMLTNESWNALLKTVEEPPKHVIFIFATTELGKFPETIISRCEVYQFKNPSIKSLEELIGRVAKKENIKLEKGVSELIAHLGDGSYRDTLSVFQKILSYSSDPTITLAEAERITQAPTGALVRDILSAILAKDKDSFLKILNDLEGKDIDYTKLTLLMLKIMRAGLVLSHSISQAQFIFDDISEENTAFITSKVKNDKTTVSTQMLASIISCHEEERITSFPGTPLLLVGIDIIDK